MSILIKWLISATALLLASALFPGISITSLWVALLVAFFLGILNALVRPVLVLLTLPITVLTLGLFIFVINALIFWFVASFVEGFKVDGFLWAFVGALFVSVVSWAMNQFIDKDKKRHRKAYTRKDNPKDKSFYRVDEIRKPEDE